MAMIENLEILRIAVVGGGLVGSAAYLALSQLEKVQVTVFERAPALREAGAWISLNPAGLSILNRLLDPSAIRQIVYRPPDKGVYVTRHWRTGEILLKSYSSPAYAPDYVQARTHRVPLLKTLAGNIPPENISYGSKVIDIHRNSHSTTIVLEDGRTHEFDLIVGADGLHSVCLTMLDECLFLISIASMQTIRRKFYPNHTVNARGTVAYRKNFPVSWVERIPGLPNDSSAWRGNGEVVFLSRLGLDVYGIVIIKSETLEYSASLRWQHAIGEQGLSRLRKHYKTWDPLISKILDLIDDIDAYPLESGAWLKDLIVDPDVAFIGDAAHPTAGAFGAGASMGFCDAWALYRALSVSRTRNGEYEVRRGLRLFNETRRYFLQRVEQQMILDFQNSQYISEAGSDEAEWIRRFKERQSTNHWLTEYDVEAEFQNKLALERTWAQLEPNDGNGISEARL